MKKSLVLAMAMALGVTASAYAANPFSDVPAGHWAYDSISKLAAAGVIEGYGDTTFGGDKLMTRYEMAQIVAKAMAKGANVDKLAAEFADELDNLGVRVAKLEKKADNVKIIGQIRAHYEDSDNDGVRDESSKLRTRIWMTGQVNENWSYTGMIQNEQDILNDVGDETTTFQRAFIAGRLGGVKVEAGRNNASILGGEILSHRADRVKAAYGKDVTLAVEGGKLASGNGSNIAGKYWAASLAGKVGKLGLEAAYIDYKDDDALVKDGTKVTTPDPVEIFDKDGKSLGYYQPADVETAVKEYTDNNIWAIAANYRFDEDWAVRAAYLKGDYENAKGEDDGYYVGVNYKGAKAAKAGTWGLYATYYDLAASTYISNGWESGIANDMRKPGIGGIEGWKIGGNVALAKNVVAAVEYHKLDAKEDSKNDTETLWSEVIFTF